MTPTITASDWPIGWLVAAMLVGLAALWIADLARRPRIPPHSDHMPAPRDLDEAKDRT